MEPNKLCLQLYFVLNMHDNQWIVFPLLYVSFCALLRGVESTLKVFRLQ